MTTEYPYREQIHDMMKVEEEHGLEKTRQIAKYQGNLGLTVNQAREIIDVIWADAPEGEKRAAALLCHSYHLNPLAGHVWLIPYNTKQQDGTYKQTWARVMGIKAKRLLASRPRPGTTEYRPVSYEDFSPRIATEAEQIKILGVADSKNLVFVCILRDTKTNATAYGIGKYPKDKEPKGTDKGNSRENMAGIRAESAALDRLRPGEMPREVIVVDEDYIDGQVLKKPSEPEPLEELTEPEIQAIWDDTVHKEAPAPPRPAPPARVPANDATAGKGVPSPTPESPTTKGSIPPGVAVPDPKDVKEFQRWCGLHGFTVKDIYTATGIPWATAIGDIGATVAALKKAFPDKFNGG